MIWLQPSSSANTLSYWTSLFFFPTQAVSTYQPWVQALFFPFPFFFFFTLFPFSVFPIPSLHLLVLTFTALRVFYYSLPSFAFIALPLALRHVLNMIPTHFILKST